MSTFARSHSAVLQQGYDDDIDTYLITAGREKEKNPGLEIIGSFLPVLALIVPIFQSCFLDFITFVRKIGIICCYLILPPLKSER